MMRSVPVVFTGKVLVLCLLLFGVQACQQVPITGRTQLSLVPQGQLLSMSYSQYSQVMKEGKLSTDTRKVNMIKTVGNNIKTAVETYMAENGLSKRLDDFEWEFNLLQDSIVNAWCMPGGKVAFYEGILPICEHEGGVAVVMGHEVAHAIAGHGAERMSQQLLASGLGIGLAIATREKPAATQAILLASYGAAAGVGILAFSRKHESESDELGLYFMAMAGYNPEEAPRFWERMSSMTGGGKKPPEFLSTHPSHETRISDLNKLMPKARQLYEKYRGK